MKFVVYTLMLAVCAQAAAAQDSTGDRVRYRLESERHWQLGFFRSISAHGLVFTADETAPLDTLPLSALNAVELHRGLRVDGSRVPFFTTMGFLAGAVILGVAESNDCGECGYGALGYVAVGGGVGAAVGLGLALIPVPEWERVHGEPVRRRSNPWSSHGLVVKYRY